jgi:AAA domain
MLKAQQYCFYFLLFESSDTVCWTVTWADHRSPTPLLLSLLLLYCQGYSNTKEAAEVIKCALAVVTKYPVGTTVKIITFYNKQRAKLNDLLDERRASISNSDALDYIDVCSIDACQVNTCTI